MRALAKMSKFAVRMKHITLHIERLLLHNDCVIVPGLGGFVAQTCSARYVEEEDLFLPPYRSVSFNPRLTMNDGLLVHDIALYHDIEYRDALRIVENEVATIRQAIENNGQYVFHGVGTLRKGTDAHFEFEPITCGVSAPELYGLDSYYVSPIDVETKSSSKLEVRKHDDDTLIFRLPMAAVRYAAVAAVAAVFFFVCIAPLNTAIAFERNEAGMLHYLYSLFTRDNSSASPKPVPASVVAKPEIKATSTESNITLTACEPLEEETDISTTDETQEITAETSIDSKSASQETGIPSLENAKTTSAPPSASAATKPYAIVVASCVTEPNAKAMVDSWKQKGLPAATINASGNVNRVFYGTYETYEKAHEALKLLKKEFKSEFAEAWVYEIH